jgi:O-antigen/teichoic acid export membrane protein
MIVFSVLAQTVYGALQGFGKLYVPGICLAIGAFVKYLINVIFVPTYGEVVPAFSTVIYNMIAFTLSFIILFRYIKEKPSIKQLFFKPLIASILMAIVTIFDIQKLS